MELHTEAKTWTMSDILLVWNCTPKLKHGQCRTFCSVNLWIGALWLRLWVFTNVYVWNCTLKLKHGQCRTFCSGYYSFEKTVPWFEFSLSS
uniref:Uncharacterized protein n=1 Tax=Strigamia maritima TaxID=126957 RepID=T1JHR8_STRMM